MTLVRFFVRIRFIAEDSEGNKCTAVYLFPSGAGRSDSEESSDSMSDKEFNILYIYINITEIMKENVITLTNAVYRILDGLPESDPLKNRAKEKTLAVLEYATVIFGAEGWFSLQKEKASLLILEDIEILINYLEIGKGQGWIDTINFLIIVKEYRKIKDNIVPPKNLLSKKNIVIISEVKNSPSKLTDENKPNSHNQFLIAKKDSEKQNLLSDKALARQAKILEILAKINKAQVSDIIKEFPDITKRTIRRDLYELLKEGKITRVGEWNQVFYQISQIVLPG